MTNQEAIDLLDDLIGMVDDEDDSKYDRALKIAIKALKDLPSAQRKGKWYMEHHTWFCSECNKNPTKGMGYVQGTDELFAYCPNCGAKMEGGEDE